MDSTEIKIGKVGRRAAISAMAGGIVSLASVGRAFAGSAQVAIGNEAKGLASVPVTLLGLPYLFGTRMPNVRYGMAQGPVALLDQAVGPAALQTVFSDVEIKMIDNVDEPDSWNSTGDFRTLPYGDEWARELVQNSALSLAVKHVREQGRVPIAALGGCSYSLGMVGGIGDAEGDIGMLWFDAHGDANTPDTSSNGFIEGMPVTMIAGQSWPKYRRRIPGFREIAPERIMTIGLNEAYASNARGDAMRAVGTVVPLPSIRAEGMAKAMTPALSALRARCSKVYIHIDPDVIDGSELKAESHAPKVGLLSAQIVEALKMVGEQFEILAVSFGPWDPNYDSRGLRVIPPLMVAAAKAAAMGKMRART